VHVGLDPHPPGEVKTDTAPADDPTRLDVQAARPPEAFVFFALEGVSPSASGTSIAMS